MTPRQLQLIHFAIRKLGLSDREYRLRLGNVAQVDSAKFLDNNGFEDLMALLEEEGFHTKGQPADYFRNKVRLRGTFCGERMAFRLRELAESSGYDLGGLCARFSNHRTREVTKLNPSEAHKLAEALKAIHHRRDAESAESEGSRGTGILPVNPGGS